MNKENPIIKKCLFPGTFDPITKGHLDILYRALPLFDEIVIGIGVNSSKKPMFPLDQRIAWIEEIFKDKPQISVASYEGLTVDFCNEINARFILRGIRFVSDFEYEKAIADMNRMLQPQIETYFLTSSPEFATVSSTLVRDVIRNEGNAKLFLPKEVKW